MMKVKEVSITVFVLGAVSLFISLRLFWNLGIFVDEYNLSPAIVSGGEFWNLMDWLRLLLLLLICIISAIDIVREE